MPEEAKDIFRMIFDLTCKRLGIDAFKHEVVFKSNHDPETDEGEGRIGLERGSIGPSWENDERELKKGKQPTIFELNLNLNQPRMELIAAMCHELVHLRQWVNGMLRTGVRDGKIIPYFYSVPLLNKTGDSRVPLDGIHYENTPWEAEAFGEMDKLASWVTQQPAYIKAEQEALQSGVVKVCTIPRWEAYQKGEEK